MNKQLPFVLVSTFKDYEQGTIGILPDYREVPLDEVDIDKWLEETKAIIFSKLEESALTMRVNQKK